MLYSGVLTLKSSVLFMVVSLLFTVVAFDIETMNTFLIQIGVEIVWDNIFE